MYNIKVYEINGQCVYNHTFQDEKWKETFLQVVERFENDEHRFYLHAYSEDGRLIADIYLVQ